MICMNEPVHSLEKQLIIGEYYFKVGEMKMSCCN